MYERWLKKNRRREGIHFIDLNLKTIVRWVREEGRESALVGPINCEMCERAGEKREVVDESTICC